MQKTETLIDWTVDQANRFDHTQTAAPALALAAIASALLEVAKALQNTHTSKSTLLVEHRKNLSSKPGKVDVPPKAQFKPWV